MKTNESTIMSEDPLPRIEEQTVALGVVDNLIQMLNQTIPVLSRIKESIEDTSNKIPRASQHLSTVTQVTESATMTILNVLDAMTDKLEKVRSETRSWNDIAVQQSGIVKNISGQLDEMAHIPGGQQIAHNLKGLIADYFRAGEHEYQKYIQQYLDNVKDDSMNIAMSLQVQDITAQQITAVSQLIESVRLRLLDVLNHFEAERPPSGRLSLNTQESAPHNDDEHLLDAASSISHATERQNDADEIIAEWNRMNSAL